MTTEANSLSSPVRIPGFVTTIIPVHNRPAMLRAAVDSVLAQSWPDIEVVIVDDGSTDETFAVAQRLAVQHPGRVFSCRQDNAGPGRARQAGLQQARGEFVQFLDSDDLLLPDKFRLQIAVLAANPRAGICYGKSFVSEDGRRSPRPGDGDRIELHVFPAVLAGRLWVTATPLYRREALQAMGPWSGLRQFEDWEYDCRAGVAGIELAYCNEYLVEYPAHSAPRLSHAWMLDRSALRDWAKAYIAIEGHARRVRIDDSAPEMQQFARSLFWMARMAGRHGLLEEAAHLFALARAHSRAGGLEFKLFYAATRLVGWRNASRLGEAARGLWK